MRKYLVLQALNKIYKQKCILSQYELGLQLFRKGFINAFAVIFQLIKNILENGSVVVQTTVITNLPNKRFLVKYSSAPCNFI